jgi:hypothetical protein
MNLNKLELVNELSDKLSWFENRKKQLQKIRTQPTLYITIKENQWSYNPFEVVISDKCLNEIKYWIIDFLIIELEIQISEVKQQLKDI